MKGTPGLLPSASLVGGGYLNFCLKIKMHQLFTGTCKSTTNVLGKNKTENWFQTFEARA